MIMKTGVLLKLILIKREIKEGGRSNNLTKIAGILTWRWGNTFTSSAGGMTHMVTLLPMSYGTTCGWNPKATVSNMSMTIRAIGYGRKSILMTIFFWPVWSAGLSTMSEGLKN
jgi:hypothetical protein